MTQSVGNIPPWPDLIAEMAVLRRRVAEVDDLYPYTVPHLAATPAELAAAERRLGHSLDPQHREFLSYGNGWPQFYLSNSLLGADELGQGAAWDDINRTLDAYYSALPEPGIVPSRDQIYPITQSRDTATVFAIWKDGPIVNGGHPVLWLPWEDSEPYDNFFEFFQVTYHEYQDELPDSKDA